MNEANREALETALASYVRSYGFPDLSTRTGVRDEVKGLAAWLCDRGVLVPAALTDEQLSLASQRMEQADDFDTMRATLARLARGEPS